MKRIHLLPYLLRGCLGFPEPRAGKGTKAHGPQRVKIPAPGWDATRRTRMLHFSQVSAFWVSTPASGASQGSVSGLVSQEPLHLGHSETLGSSGDISPAFLGEMHWVPSPRSAFFSPFWKETAGLQQTLQKTCGKSASSWEPMRRKRVQHQTEQLEPMKDFAGFYLLTCGPSS